MPLRRVFNAENAENAENGLKTFEEKGSARMFGLGNIAP